MASGSSDFEMVKRIFKKFSQLAKNWPLCSRIGFPTRFQKSNLLDIEHTKHARLHEKPTMIETKAEQSPPSHVIATLQQNL